MGLPEPLRAGVMEVWQTGHGHGDMASLCCGGGSRRQRPRLPSDLLLPDLPTREKGLGDTSLGSSVTQAAQAGQIVWAESGGTDLALSVLYLVCSSQGLCEVDLVVSTLTGS